MKISIYKSRSFYACIRDAYFLFSQNAITILKKTWISSLVFALFLTLCFIFRLPNKGLHDWGLENPTMSWSIQTFVYLMLLFSGIFYKATIFNLVNPIGLKKNIIRYIKIFAIFALLEIVLLYSDTEVMLFIFRPSSSFSNIAKIALACVCILAMTIILLAVVPPFVYIIPKYMIDEKAKLSLLPKLFKTGLHHWGKIFTTCLLLFIILGIALFIITSPALILSLAQTISQMGALLGDALGTPGYFPTLVTITLLITCFILAYTLMYTNMVFIYVYGSIEKQEQERQQQFNYETN